MPAQGQFQEEKDTAAETNAALAWNQHPGRPPSPTPPDASGGDKEHHTPRGHSALPSSEEPETLDTPDCLPRLFQLPEMLGLNTLPPEAFGPIDNFTALFLEDVRSILRGLDQLMECVETDSISASSWLLLGLAAVAACEVARRQFRENSSLDALGESTGEPALV
jgi:hypothetical protein